MHGWKEKTPRAKSIAVNLAWNALFSVFLIVTLLCTSAAVCNAHVSEATHADCPLHVDTSATGGGQHVPTSLPTGPHHCPYHSCPHLHGLYLTTSAAFAPVFDAAMLSVSERQLHRPLVVLSIFQPPEM